jgi:NTE family protein
MRHAIALVPSAWLLLVATAAGAGCPASRSAAGAPTALVLSGGGAKGAWEAGFATALVSGGIPVRLVAGSSTGALNATMLTDGRLDRLEAVWRTITRERVYALRPSVVLAGLLPGFLTLASINAAGSLLDPHPLRALIVGSIDLERVRRSPTRVLVVATDLERRAKRIFDNATLSVDALMAATALPGVFPPVAIDGALLVDGGLLSRSPVDDALDAPVDVDRAIVLVSAAPERALGRRPSLRAVLEEAFETAMAQQIRRDAELAGLRHPRVEVQVVSPSAPLPLRPLDFDPPRIGAAFDRGRADGLACLERWTEASR